jgi:hypothetical protein
MATGATGRAGKGPAQEMGKGLIQGFRPASAALPSRRHLSAGRGLVPAAAAQLTGRYATMMAFVRPAKSWSRPTRSWLWIRPNHYLRRTAGPDRAHGAEQIVEVDVGEVGGSVE